MTFAGQSKNVQRTITLILPMPATITPISMIQGTLPAAAAVVPSTTPT